MRGYRGLAERDYMALDMRTVSGILPLGGTILRTSSYEPSTEDARRARRRGLRARRLDAVVAIGGEHTMEITRQLHEDEGLPLIGVPKTIDNDIVGTDYTFGFDTAVHIVSEAIDRLHTTAQSHDRVMVVEVMGRNAGWIALHGGIAGGADAIVIPELDTTCEEIADAIKRATIAARTSRSSSSPRAQPGVRDGEVRQISINEETDEYGYERLGGIGAALAKELEAHDRLRGPDGRARPHPARRHARPPTTGCSPPATASRPTSWPRRASSAGWSRCSGDEIDSRPAQRGDRASRRSTSSCSRSPSGSSLS